MDRFVGLPYLIAGEIFPRQTCRERAAEFTVLHVVAATTDLSSLPGG